MSDFVNNLCDATTRLSNLRVERAAARERRRQRKIERTYPLSTMVGETRLPFLAGTEYMVINKEEPDVEDPSWDRSNDVLPFQGEFQTLHVVVIPKVNNGKDLYVDITDQVRACPDKSWNVPLKMLRVFINSFLEQNPDWKQPSVFVPPTTIDIDDVEEQLLEWFEEHQLLREFPARFFTRTLRANEEAAGTFGIHVFRWKPNSCLEERLKRRILNEWISLRSRLDGGV